MSTFGADKRTATAKALAGVHSATQAAQKNEQTDMAERDYNDIIFSLIIYYDISLNIIIIHNFHFIFVWLIDYELQ